MANERVQMRPTTWREQFARVALLPVALLLWVLAPAGAGWIGTAVWLASFVAPTVLTWRGRAALRRARDRLSDPDAVLPRLRAVASGVLVGSAVRCDAVAHAALIEIERGDLEAALRSLAVVVPDGDSSVRARTPSVGYFGEAVRSVVAWLFPESGLTPVASTVLRPPQGSNAQRAYEGVAPMVAVLRVLEAGGRHSAPAVVRAWAEVDVAALAEQYPAVTALVLGAVFRFEPAVHSELRQRVEQLAPEARALLIRRYPELSSTGGDAYRAPAAVETTALERVAPAELQALRAKPGLSRWLPLAGNTGPWTAFLTLWMMMVAASSADPLFFLVAGVFGVLSAGWFVHRRDRVRPLKAAGITAPVRLRELASMSARAGPRTWTTAPPHPFDHGELMLLVGLSRAEDALRQGDEATAREQIAWWLQGLDSAALRSLDLAAIGSSAVRMSTLLGYPEACVRIDKAIRVVDPSVGRRRSGHGSTARAVWMARALAAAHRGRMRRAADALDHAATSRPVQWDAFETELYGVLLRRLSSAGHVIPPALHALLGPEIEPVWVSSAWPHREGDPGDSPPLGHATPALAESPSARQ